MTITLSITPTRANIFRLPNNNRVGDSYCIVSYGEQISQTQVCYDMGKNPEWKDKIALKFEENSYTILIEIHNKFDASLIGVCELDFEEVLKEGELEFTNDIYFNQDPIGRFTSLVKYSSPELEKKKEYEKKVKAISKATNDIINNPYMGPKEYLILASHNPQTSMQYGRPLTQIPNHLIQGEPIPEEVLGDDVLIVDGYEV